MIVTCMSNVTMWSACLHKPKMSFGEPLGLGSDHCMDGEPLYKELVSYLIHNIVNTARLKKRQI